MGVDKEFLKKNWILIVFILILLSGFIIRLYIYADTVDQPLWWDEADYMSYSKRIGKNLDINDVWYYRRTFLMPLIWGGMFGLGFGEGAIRFTEVLFGLGLIIFGYLAAKEMFNEKIGLIVAAGLAFSRLSLFLGTRFMTSLPATCFFLCGLWLFWRGYVNKKGNKLIWLSGLFIGCAIFTRFALFICLIPLGLYVIFNEKGKFWKNKHVWIGFGILFLVLLPFIIKYGQHYPGGLMDFIKHYLSSGGGTAGPSPYMGIAGVWAYIKSISLNIGWLFSISVILGLSLFLNLLCIDKIFKNKNVNKTLFILIWILVPLFYHGMYSEYVQERYLLWIYPAVLMLSGLGIIKGYNYVKNNKKLISVFLICLVALILVFSYLQISMGNELIENKKMSYWQVKDAGIWMKENSNPSDIMISNSIPQIQYYSERSIYMAQNISHLENLNPKYIMASSFEKSADWFYQYPQEKNLPIVKAYFADAQKTQPLLIIYEYS